MPHVIVKYHPAVEKRLSERVAESALDLLRLAVEAVAADELSVTQLSLSSDDFSMIFVPAGLNDHLKKDFEVVILAHAFQERLDNIDAITEAIGLMIAATLNLCGGDASYSLSVFVCPMGYVAENIPANSGPPSD